MIQRDGAQADRMVASGDPWYTADQFRTELHGIYRHSIRLRFRCVRRLLEKLDTTQDRLAGKTLVDLGCGDGVWSVLIREQFRCQLIGVDYNRLRLDRYATHVPGALTRLGSCYEIPLADDATDIVLFNQVLEHLEQPADALREIRRILRPRGHLIISVPNEGTWLKQRVQYRFIQPEALKTSDHLQFFTGASLSDLLVSCGFHVERLDLLGFYFPHNGVSRRLVQRRWTYAVGLGLARLFPVLHDCIFALACRERSGEGTTEPTREQDETFRADLPAPRTVFAAPAQDRATTVGKDCEIVFASSRYP
jgi:SAM-dependent methyltransferase